MNDVIRFTCPVCGQKYRAPTRLAGRHRICVKCATPYDIPSPEAASVRQSQHQAVSAASQTVHEEIPARIPPAGPVSQFAAALSESHAEAHAETDALSESTADARTETAAPSDDNVPTDVETTVLQPVTPPLIVSPPAAETEPPAPERHPCPFCGEDILVTAVKCKHCGEFLSGNPRPAEAPVAEKPDDHAIAEALARAELTAADARARSDQAAADARAKAQEVAAVAQRNEERIAAINRQIEMQAESDYRQVLLRAADSLAAAERSAVSQCRFYSDVYHAVERMGVDPIAAMARCNHRTRNSGSAEPRDTLSVIAHVMDLIGNPPMRFKRAYEKIVEAFAAYSQMDELSRTPPTNMVAREASLADLHTRFTASMTDMRGLIRTSGV